MSEGIALKFAVICAKFSNYRISANKRSEIYLKQINFMSVLLIKNQFSFSQRFSEKCFFKFRFDCADLNVQSKFYNFALFEDTCWELLVGFTLCKLFSASNEIRNQKCSFAESITNAGFWLVNFICDWTIVLCKSALKML